MSSKTMLYALHTVQRLVPGSETRATEEIKAGRVFEAADAKEADSLTRLGAVRPATKGEIAEDEDRREVEGSETERPTLFASKSAETTKPAKAGTKAGKSDDTADIL